MEWFAVGVVVVIVFFVATGSVIGAAKKTQEADPDRFLDEWFDGRDQAIVDQSPSTLSAEAILAGANARGYRCISSEPRAYPNNSQTRMIFERTATGATPDEEKDSSGGDVQP